MIVGIALAKIFENLVINVNSTDVAVAFHFGDQKEYNNWIASKIRSQKQKFPLIWYVTAPHKRLKDGSIDVDSQLILFMGTNQNYNNVERYVHNYQYYLEPLYSKINEIFEKSPFIQLLESPINDFDEPNFGASNDANFLDNSQKNKPQSIGIEIVDAKVLKIKINLKTNCIL